MGKRGVQPRPIMDRVWERIPQGDPDACWLWPGRRTRQGYGTVSTSHGKAPALVTRLLLAETLWFTPRRNCWGDTLYA